MIWRKCLLALLIMAILISGATQVSAWRAAKTKWVIGDVVYGNEVVLQKPMQTLFHQQTLAATDTETMAISFPAATAPAGIAATNSQGLTIAQTSDAVVLGTNTGYYVANWCFNAFSNNGGLILGDLGSITPAIAGPMLGSGLIWPYMNTPDPTAGYTAMKFKPYMDSSEIAGNVTISPGSGMINNTPANISSPTVVAANNTSVSKSKTPISYRNATKEQIRNTSALERMWRNANLVNTIPQAYKGTVERPTWIYPDSNVLKMVNRNTVISDSMNMTRPGEKAHTVFWDL